MKRVLLSSVAMLCAFLSFSQLQENFDPSPSGWILSQGAAFQNVGTNAGVVTPGVGGNNPAQIGTPAVNKTSNTFEVCFDVQAYASNLNTQLPFPCNTYVDILFVKSSVTSANDANMPENILARVDNHLLPGAGGNTCVTFTFPPAVTDPTFKVFLSFHADCNQGGIKYVIDNVNISGVNLICGGTNCPPGTSNDVFTRPAGELTFNGILYGSPIDPSYPSLPAGHAFDPGGTDGDQNDPYPNLKWQLVSGPANGNAIVNANGTVSITRNSLSITQVVFTYQLCDDGPDNDFNTTGDNLCSDVTTVMVNWPAGNPMPVTLNGFNATKVKNMVTLTWQTVTEIDNTGFEIERNAENTGFKKVGFIASKAVGGNSNSKLNYEFKETNQTAGTTLYRLRQVDINGNAHYSYIKSVKGDGASFSVTIYPTPSKTGDVSISVSGLQSFNVIVTDTKGIVVKEFKNPGTDFLRMTALQSGMYVARITDLKTGEQSTEKIIVSRK